MLAEAIRISIKIKDDSTVSISCKPYYLDNKLQPIYLVDDVYFTTLHGIKDLREVNLNTENSLNYFLVKVLGYSDNNCKDVLNGITKNISWMYSNNKTEESMFITNLLENTLQVIPSVKRKYLEACVKLESSPQGVNDIEDFIEESYTLFHNYGFDYHPVVNKNEDNININLYQTREVAIKMAYNQISLKDFSKEEI